MLNGNDQSGGINKRKPTHLDFKADRKLAFRSLFHNLHSLSIEVNEQYPQSLAQRPQHCQAAQIHGSRGDNRTSAQCLRLVHVDEVTTTIIPLLKRPGAPQATAPTELSGGDIADSSKKSVATAAKLQPPNGVSPYEREGSLHIDVL